MCVTQCVCKHVCVIKCLEIKSAKTFSTYLMELQSFLIVIVIVLQSNLLLLFHILFFFLLKSVANQTTSKPKPNRTKPNKPFFHFQLKSIHAHICEHMNVESAQKQKTICTKSCTAHNFLRDDGPFFLLI